MAPIKWLLFHILHHLGGYFSSGIDVYNVSIFFAILLKWYLIHFILIFKGNEYDIILGSNIHSYENKHTSLTNNFLINGGGKKIEAKTMQWILEKYIYKSSNDCLTYVIYLKLISAQYDNGLNYWNGIKIFFSDGGR